MSILVFGEGKLALDTVLAATSLIFWQKHCFCMGTLYSKFYNILYVASVVHTFLFFLPF